MTIPNKEEISIGQTVGIETKENQGTGNLTDGTIKEILTSSKSHPYGIKVRLSDGSVGRVKKILAQISKHPHMISTEHHIDLDKIQIPTTEDEHTEFKEFYQYDEIMNNLTNMPQKEQSSIINSKKREVQERFVTAICAFGNKNGGFVYLGIKSDGSISGLEKDRMLGGFKDYSDAFSRHIDSCLRSIIKDDPFVIDKLRMRFREIDGKTICIIHVSPSTKPLFLHSKRGQDFYVRGIAPESIKLDGKDRAEYIYEHFYKNK